MDVSEPHPQFFSSIPYTEDLELQKSGETELNTSEHGVRLHPFL